MAFVLTFDDIEKCRADALVRSLHYFAVRSGHIEMPPIAIVIEVENKAHKAADFKTKTMVLRWGSTEDWRTYRGIAKQPPGFANRPTEKQRSPGDRWPRRYGRQSHRDDWSQLAAKFTMQAQEERWASWIAGPGEDLSS